MRNLGAFGVDVMTLCDDQLAAALVFGTSENHWTEYAAVDLLMAEESWLSRVELRSAVYAIRGEHGDVFAWVDWSAVPTDALASSGQLRILALSRSLGGVASERSLADHLVGLDDDNAARVLRAFWTAFRGRTTAPDPLWQAGSAS